MKKIVFLLLVGDFIEIFWRIKEHALHHFVLVIKLPIF